MPIECKVNGKAVFDGRYFFIPLVPGAFTEECINKMLQPQKAHVRNGLDARNSDA